MASNEGIQQLIHAEAEAARIVEEARSYRKAKLKSAEASAREAIASFRAQQQALFDSEVSANSGSADSYQATLDAKTQADLAVMKQRQVDHNDEIVDLLIHQVTTVPLSVPIALAQCIQATNPQ